MPRNSNVAYASACPSTPMMKRLRWRVALAVLAMVLAREGEATTIAEGMANLEAQFSALEARAALLDSMYKGEPSFIDRLGFWQGSYQRGACNNSYGDPCGTGYSWGAGGGFSAD